MNSLCSDGGAPPLPPTGWAPTELRVAIDCFTGGGREKKEPCSTQFWSSNCNHLGTRTNLGMYGGARWTWPVRRAPA